MAGGSTPGPGRDPPRPTDADGDRLHRPVRPHGGAGLFGGPRRPDRRVRRDEGRDGGIDPDGVRLRSPGPAPPGRPPARRGALPGGGRRTTRGLPAAADRCRFAGREPAWRSTRAGSEPTGSDGGTGRRRIGELRARRSAIARWRAPARSIQNSADCVPLAVTRCRGRFGVLGEVLEPKRLGQLDPAVGREAECREKARLETPDWMSAGEFVVAQLRLLNRGPIGVGNQHEWILSLRSCWMCLAAGQRQQPATPDAIPVLTGLKARATLCLLRLHLQKVQEFRACDRRALVVPSGVGFSARRVSRS